MIKRFLKNAAKRSFMIFHQNVARLGVHILPVHYYSAIPDIVSLKHTRSDWARRSSMPGVEYDIDRSIDFLRSTCSCYQQEYEPLNIYKEATEKGYGLGYGLIEAQFLYSLIRETKPRKIIEVGSGVSTACMLEALKRNEESVSDYLLTCIEPNPSMWLQDVRNLRLVKQPVQRVPVALFQELDDGDLLFIDSSHTVKTGSDVNYLLLEVLPLLRAGVLVHFHDIYFPFDYQRDVLETVWQWSESSLLRAYLVYNRHVEMILCFSILHYDYPEVLKSIFPSYVPEPAEQGLRKSDNVASGSTPRHFPSSTYIRVKTSC